MFTQYNTDGYTDQQLIDLNAEWEQRARDLNLQPGTDEYAQAEKDFADEVARR